MICFAKENQGEQIASLWQEAFGDSREWVMMYLAENIENVLVYEENDVVMGMLSLLSVSYKGKNGFYVYGVATGKEFRSKGISTQLLEFAKKLVDEKKAEFLVLVPRNEGLFDFYEVRGFFRKHRTKTECFKKDELEKLSSSEVYVASAEDYYGIRSTHFDNLIEWDVEKLVSIRKFENGEFYKNDGGEGAFCYAYKDTLYVKELCGELEFAGGICKKYPCENVVVTRKMENDLPSCMVYPDFCEDVFFNISID